LVLAVTPISRKLVEYIPKGSTVPGIARGRHVYPIKCMLTASITGWFSANSVINMLGFIVLFTTVYNLKDKPLALRFRVAVTLGVFSVACFVTLRFLP
jgi:hypothetical protein